MALIITAVLLICHWLCAVDSHSVIDTCSKPVLYPTTGCFTCVGECWWLPHAHPETEQFLSMAPHFLFLYVCRFSKFRIVFVCICFHSSEFCSNVVIRTFKGSMTSYCQLFLSFTSYVRLFFLHLPVSLPQPFVLFMPRHPSPS